MREEIRDKLTDTVNMMTNTNWKILKAQSVELDIIVFKGVFTLNITNHKLKSFDVVHLSGQNGNGTATIIIMNKIIKGVTSLPTGRYTITIFKTS